MKKFNEITSVVTLTFFLISTVMFFVMNVTHQKSKARQETKHQKDLYKLSERKNKVIIDRDRDIEFYEKIFDPLSSEENGYVPPSKRGKVPPPAPKKESNWWN